MFNLLKKMFAPQKKTEQVEAFTFGDPDPVLDAREIMDLTESWWNGEWYEPPVSLPGLIKTMRAAVHHSSALYLKRNLLVKTFIPHPKMSKHAFSKFALDFLWSGNGYLEPISNRLGGALSYKPALAKYVRRGKGGRYFWVPNYLDKHELPSGMIHLLDPDPNQELYGVPEYMAGLQSVWLNEAATLFRRKYYKNGSHAGFILYISDAMNSETDIDALRTALKDAKGPGNFRNLFMYAPNGKKDGIQVIPIAEVMAKDEFLNIKTITRDDQLAIHRVPPQLMGVIPEGGAAFGDARTAIMVFALNEIEPLQERMTAVNEMAGEEIIRFTQYGVPESQQPAA